MTQRGILGVIRADRGLVFPTIPLPWVFTALHIDDATGICGSGPHNRVPVFENVHHLLLTRCDKNFVHHFIHGRTFPHVKTLFLASHPCEPEFFGRFPYSSYCVREDFGEYARRWAKIPAFSHSEFRDMWKAVTTDCNKVDLANGSH